VQQGIEVTLARIGIRGAGRENVAEEQDLIGRGIGQEKGT
jgi:hypothetical protein